MHAAVCFGTRVPPLLIEWPSRGGWTTRSDLCAGGTKLLHTTVKNVMLTKP